MSGEERKYRKMYEHTIKESRYLRDTGQCRPENGRCSDIHDSGFYDALERAMDNPERYVPILCGIVRDATLDGFRTDHLKNELEEIVKLLDALDGKGVFSW
jgi:hypothetical protein